MRIVEQVDFGTKTVSKKEQPAPLPNTIDVLNMMFEQEATAKIAFNKITEIFVGADYGFSQNKQDFRTGRLC